MVRMRLITQAYEYIKEQDNETAITKNAFRKLVNTGLIPSVKVGNKILVDLNEIDNFFTSGFPTAVQIPTEPVRESEPAPKTNTVRKLDERVRKL